MPTQMYIKKFERSTTKSGRMHICQLKMQELSGPQGSPGTCFMQELSEPQGSPGTRPILAHFAHLTPLYYICKAQENFLPPPP